MTDDHHDSPDRFVGLTLDSETVENLDRIAKETHRSRAGLVRLAIERLIDAEKLDEKGGRQ